jgi:F0F1-type ATP synthase assembly protein I
MKDAPKNQQSGLFSSLGLVGNLGFQIAAPLILFAVVGRALDVRFHTSPWFLLGGILLSIILSSIAITKNILTILSSEGDHKDNKKNEPPSSKS